MPVFLRINDKTPNKFVSFENGGSNKSAARFELCKFETISIIEDKKENGNPTDDKNSRDNIKYKDEKEYKENDA